MQGYRWVSSGHRLLEEEISDAGTLKSEHTAQEYPMWMR
jgi:hypothetical protein